MRIIITGGEGFIGSNLALKLLNKNIRVSSIDFRKENNYLEINGIDQYKADIRNYNSLKNTINGVDGVIHLAALSRVIWAEKHTQLCLDSNIKGTLNVLEAIQKSKNKPWFILGSSREVYGETNGSPISESNQLEPINIYGISKLSAEKITRLYSSKHNINSVILRFSNVYGGLNDIFDRVTPKFVLQSLMDKPVQINGGEQIFDFTHIDDTVDGILASIDYLNNNGNERINDSFHILPGEANTLQKLASNIQNILNKEIEVKFAPRRTYDVDKFVGNPTKASEILRFKCKYNFLEGLKRTIKLYSDEYERNPKKILQKFRGDSKCEY